MLGVSRPLDERLLKLPQWAMDYVRDLEAELLWMELVVERRQREGLRQSRAAINGNLRRIKDAKPKGVLF